MKRALVLILALLCIISLAGCRGKPRILLNDEYLQITQTGGKIDVYDVLSDESYTFILKRTKPLGGDVEPIRVINTKNLIIDKYPKKLLITDLNTNENYTICISILGVKAVFNGHLWDKQGGDTE